MSGELGGDRPGNRARRAALLIAALAPLGLACIEPQDQRPGLYVSGEVVNEPVSDWSFTDAAQEVFVETRAWYLLPHSVTTHVATADGQLYVGSLYREGGEFPGRPWNRNALRNPNVRLKVGDKVYRLRAVRVTDPAESAAALAAIGAKYPQPWGEVLAQPEAERAPVYFFRLEPRE